MYNEPLMIEYLHLTSDMDYKPALFDDDQPTTRTLRLLDVDLDDLKIFLKGYDNGTEPQEMPPNDNKHSVYFAELGIYLYITAGEFAEISNHIIDNYNQAPINLNIYQVYYSTNQLIRFNDDTSVQQRKLKLEEFQRVDDRCQITGNYITAWLAYEGINKMVTNYNSFYAVAINTTIHLTEKNVAVYLPMYLKNYDMSERSIVWNLGKSLTNQTIFPVCRLYVIRDIIRLHPPAQGERLIAYLVRLRAFGFDPRDKNHVVGYIKSCTPNNPRLYIRGVGYDRYFIYGKEVNPCDK